MAPSTSTRQQVIFDGTDELLSFDTFIHQLASSENWIDTTGFAFTEHAEHIVPSFLFGAALRYYETLDSDCQDEWSLLRDAMAGRFPGGIRSGGTIQRSVMQWDEDGLKTPAQAPPITAATPLAPISVVEVWGPADEESAIQKTPYISLSILRSKLRLPLFTPSLSQANSPKEPQVTVHSMFIQYAHGGTAWKPQSTKVLVTVDSNDHQSVIAAKKRPLTTILSNDSADRYQVGYTFTVHHGERIIDFHHSVEAPRSAKTRHIQPTGNHTVSPECRGRWSGASPITDFIPHSASSNAPDNKPLPGTYVIKSHLGSRKPGTYRTDDPSNELEELGAITWMLQITSK
ncbi:hypothetical protein FS837_012619 [Tulasnella sp. UAMH 9824]|nr:hypothetical protein FS837_012619 [Tulasnella sp. UAMH 9824]